MHAALSPTPIDSNSDWSFNNNNKTLKTLPDTPPISQHTSASASTTDGGMQNGIRRPGGNPSPPSSISRSSDGNGLYAPSIAGSVDSRRGYVMEDTLFEHYRVLKIFLAPYLRDERGEVRQNRARDKLLRLSSIQFQELSTDVYDELLRREDERRKGGHGVPNATPHYLLPRKNFHFKRNQARQKLSTLPADRFQQLATDVFFELERRYPGFTGGGDRADSRAGSMESTRVPRPNFAPPPRTASRGAPDVQRSAGGHPQFHNGPQFDMPSPGIQPALNTPPNDYGRPLPKTFQSNTIIPNKGMLVEDDDDEDPTRNPARSLGGNPAALRSQVTRLEQKVDELQGQLVDQASELEKMRLSNQNQQVLFDKERSEWKILRENLEAKVKQAQTLQDSLQTELDQIRNQSSVNEREMRDELEGARRNERELERDLRSQLDEARRIGQEVEHDLKAQIDALAMNATRNRSRADSAPNDWQERHAALEIELAEQRQVTEEVRRDAAESLMEMRSLSTQSADALDKEERLLDSVAALECEVRDWKSRYAKVKSLNRSLRSSSLGLQGINGDGAQLARDSPFIASDGLVTDFHLTNYQLSIDSLLQLARKSDLEAMIESMKQVVVCVRQISADIDVVSTTSSSLDGSQSEPTRGLAQLRQRLSQTANNLITASKLHASAAGITPVSLVDAAASHLTAAVVELIRTVKIRPTPAGELDGEERGPMEPAALGIRGKMLPVGGTPYTNGKVNGTNGANGHIRDQASMYSTVSSGAWSQYSRYSRSSNNMSSARHDVPNGGASSHGLGISEAAAAGMQQAKDIEVFKNYLEDSTALLVSSVQPLVNTVRTGGVNNQDLEAEITEYIREISSTVREIASKSDEAVYILQNPALQKHIPPVVQALERGSDELARLHATNKPYDSLPPIAFKIARATKELILRVDRIKTGELTKEMSLPSEF